MKTLQIEIKNKTNLTLQLEKKYTVSYSEKNNSFIKLFLKKDKNLDIYFHQGSITKEAKEFAKNAKLVIVNSKTTKNSFLDVDHNKIEIIEPYFIPKIDYDKIIKKQFKAEYHISKNTRIIFFRGKDLLKSGIHTVFDILSRMYEESFVLVIESTSKEIIQLRKQMEKVQIKYRYILFEDKKEIEQLFIAADIFLLPTTTEYFSLDILKAFYYKTAVFVMENNAASEIVDVFSYIQGPEDRSVSFKIDSLLLNPIELKNIQKANQKKSKEFTLEKSLEKISNLIDKSFDN